MPNCTSDGRILQFTLVGPVKAMSAVLWTDFCGVETWVLHGKTWSGLSVGDQRFDGSSYSLSLPRWKGGFLRVEGSCVSSLPLQSSRSIVAEPLKVLMPWVCLELVLHVLIGSYRNLILSWESVDHRLRLYVDSLLLAEGANWVYFGVRLESQSYFVSLCPHIGCVFSRWCSCVPASSVTTRTIAGHISDVQLASTKRAFFWLCCLDLFVSDIYVIFANPASLSCFPASWNSLESCG
jgi:hypothetical protein